MKRSQLMLGIALIAVLVLAMAYIVARQSSTAETAILKQTLDAQVIEMSTTFPLTRAAEQP